MKYRFIGYIEYVPKNDREWHIERKAFDMVIQSRHKDLAELKLQIRAFCMIKVPATRINFEYKCEEINEVD